VLEGYNGTIFAYGQTSSGKTHTMEVRALLREVELSFLVFLSWEQYSSALQERMPRLLENQASVK